MNEKGIYLTKIKARDFKVITFILTVILTICCLGLSTEKVIADTGISIILDGERLSLDANKGVPFIDTNGRTLVPFRGVMEAFGGDVDWDNDNRIAFVEKDGILVQAPIDQNIIIVNGVTRANDTAAIIKDDHTYLPIRAVLEAFGAGVAWDNNNRAVIINSDGTVADTGSQDISSENTAAREGELNGMWISYLEYMNMPKEEAAFKAEIDKMFDRCKEVGMNAVFVHARSHCDAMYPSNYYPWAAFASGTQGVNPGYDPLEYMVNAAHSRGLEFHAWLNPYRVTGYGTYWSQVSDSNPVKVWLSDSDTTNDRWALKHKGEYYLNPSVPEVRDMVINGVEEIVRNYDVDGIHFDDYFYPSVSDTDPSLWFDKLEYDKSGSLLGIVEWRRENVNLLVKGVYDSINLIDPNVEFGISPAGNLNNLRSTSNHFVDIDKWFSQSGYVDYIMPQLYWGFEVKDSSGNIASYAYENNLNSWISLANRGNVTLYIGLDMANAGTDVSDRNETSEWLRYNDIIARQVLTARATGKVDGFAYFRYEFFNKNVTQGEVNNLINVLK